MMEVTYFQEFRFLIQNHYQVHQYWYQWDINSSDFVQLGKTETFKYYVAFWPLTLPPGTMRHLCIPNFWIIWLLAGHLMIQRCLVDFFSTFWSFLALKSALILEIFDFDRSIGSRSRTIISAIAFDRQHDSNTLSALFWRTFEYLSYTVTIFNNTFLLSVVFIRLG